MGGLKSAFLPFSICNMSRLPTNRLCKKKSLLHANSCGFKIGLTSQKSVQSFLHFFQMIMTQLEHHNSSTFPVFDLKIGMDDS